MIETGKIRRLPWLPELAALLGVRVWDLLALPRPVLAPGPALASAPGLDPPWWTVPETSAALGVPRLPVYQLIGAGELDAQRAGRSWRIQAASARAYLAGTQPPPRPVPARPPQHPMLAGIDRQQLRALRTARGWTQLQLARSARLSLSSISALETGHSTHHRAVPALARALGVTPAELTAPAPGHPPAPQPPPPPAPGADTRPAARAQGTRLRELRAQRGLSQAQLARRAGLSRPFLSTLERGHRHRPDLLPALARALAVTPAELAARPPLRKQPAATGNPLTSITASPGHHCF